ncbi:NAD(P)/FAD-dependent oxidoreductase [Notoacmeibacter ruber]|uniref:NAD(P)/FAD-dependent oxidoreductase n=2 Tax=Notoacmeibacter ruber TaxID=2670375 RepID=A0A3L7JF44_9HYPH|nr:NAD(P)/FAD-dependent oxidoreductase [Notoacmeibacter ruber]
MRTTDLQYEVTDVVIFGAGLSGIGCAAYLHRKLPGKSYQILEMRDDLGGTWDLFRYPGIRSDSDLYTFSYEFKPWKSDKSIAPAEEIKSYIAETADEYDVRERIRFGRKVIACDWSSEEALWTVTTERTGTGERETWRARWIFSATGYYDYDQGYRPEFAQEGSFDGPIIHPQSWPDDLDYTDKRIAVIGSGATAVTLLPALSEKAAHVTQVQRTPTYVLPLPTQDPWLRWLRPFLSADRIHRTLRTKNIMRQSVFWRISRRFPNWMRNFVRKLNVKYLPEDYPIDTHFNPPYDPWDQRLCFVPGADLFKRLEDGSCSIVTGKIARFDESGIAMEDGSHVDADIIVTATGLNLKLMGGAEYAVDGKAVHWPDHLIYKGMMLDNIPNFAFSIGYTNSSWTLKVGLLCEYFCRLLAEMDERGMGICYPERPDRQMKTRPLLDFQAGYVQRSIDILPRQGDTYPWEMTFNYREDAKMMKRGAVIGPELHLEPSPAPFSDAAQ